MISNRRSVFAGTVVLLGIICVGCGTKEPDSATGAATTESGQVSQQQVQQNPAIPPEAKAQISQMEQRERANSAASIPSALKNQPAK